MERVIYSDNGTLTDLSEELNLFTSKTATFSYVTAEDYIYVGSDLPFNHKYFDVTTTVNAETASVTVEYWDGTQWVEAVDVIDETSDSGASLAVDGHIQWNIDKDLTGWAREDTDDITALSTLRIYDLYWARFSWDASLTANVKLNYIGYKFAEDGNIGPFYPEIALSATKTQFQTGKTDWNEQHFIAAQHIINDLKRKGVILNKNQILNWRQFTEASVHKLAELVFNAFGDDFKDNRKTANEYYVKALDLIIFHIDRDRNARLDLDEKFIRTGFMSR